MPGEIRYGLVFALLLRSVAPMYSQAPSAEKEGVRVQEQLERTRDAFEQELLSNPTDNVALEGMSSLSEQLALNERAAGRMDGALAVLLRAKKVEPEDKRVLLDLGILENEMALYLDAAGTLQHLETLPPFDPNAYYALARVDMSMGRLSEAEDQMRAYLRAMPLDASAHFGLGRIYMQGLEFEKAEGEFRRSIELQPKQSEAYYQLGELELSQNKFEDSIKLFAMTLDRSPDHGGALAGTGTACFKLKQYDKAKDWLMKATRAAPDYQPGHYYLGLTLARLGDQVNSRRELDLATSLAAKDSKQAASRLRLNPDGKP